MRRSLSSLFATVLVLAVVRGETAIAQRISDTRPRFLLASNNRAAPVPVDISRSPALKKPLTLDLNGVSVKDALAAISRGSGIRIFYVDNLVANAQPKKMRAEGITVAAALTEVLSDLNVDVVFGPDGSATIVERERSVAVAETATIAGTVREAKTGQPVASAQVSVVGTGLGGTADDIGRYSIAGVSRGAHQVSVRHFGYTPVNKTVDVPEAGTVTVDFALEKSAGRLDRVVVTGTVVPTEVRALPMPMTVVSDSDIARQRPQTIQALLRQAVPTQVSWDYPSLPYLTSFSVRGSSGLAVGVAQMKVFVDGVEVANPAVSPVDPNSIARIEVIRGPQAAAIYGSDAIGGVLQIITKRNEAPLLRPQIDGQVSLGIIQTPYSGYGSVPRQSYATSLTGGGADAGYNFGASYSNTGDYLPNDQRSKQSNPSFYGGAHFTTGIVTTDISGRYFTNNFQQAFNPELTQTGFLLYSKPLFTQANLSDQTIGARIRAAPVSWLENSVSLGFDRTFLSAKRTQPRRTTPADTLLSLVEQTRTKASFGYNASVRGRVGPDVAGSLAVGFDHWDLDFTGVSAQNAVTTSGTLQTVTPTSYSRTLTTNTGVFTQGQVGFRDRLFGTAGVRVEWNSDFGESVERPVSPQLGISYVQPTAVALLKLRGSWGRAIKAPAPNRKLAVPTGTSLFLANTELAPERQQGYDAGVDAVFGRGSLSLSYYDQTADNLIQVVVVQTAPQRLSQYQNVGRVKNSGIEVEGTWTAGPMQFRGQYGTASAKIATLAPGFVGDLKVGDQTMGTPKQTAGASMSARVFSRTSVTAGATYVGSWTNYDDLALYGCLGRTGPCRTTNRDYIVSYPSFVKLNAALTQDITPRFSGFVSMDNVTNNQAYELTNDNPVFGRITTIGVRVRN